VAQANPLLAIGTDIRDTVVTRTLVSVGQRVEEGAVLLSLEDRAENLRVARALAEIASLRQQVKERESLVAYYDDNRDRGLGLEADLRRGRYDLARTQGELAVAQVDLDLARLDLDKRQLRAPRAGVVVSVAPPGFSPLQGREFATIAVTDPIRLDCTLAQDKLSLTSPGQLLKASFFAWRGGVWEGKVIRVEPVAGSDEHTVTVVAELANPDGRLLPGLRAVAELIDEGHGLRVPSVALINPGFDVAQVFVVDAQERASLRQIEIGSSAVGYTELRAGLSAGERVVVAGQAGLQHGDTVRVANEQTPPE
jgi:RND family efflux transporter MFP subunit